MEIDLIAERAALALIEAYGHRPVPGISLIGIADALGVSGLRVESSLEDGRVEFACDGPRIVISQNTGRQRQCFTLAHELGHVLLADPEEELLAFSVRPSSHEAVERFCDSFGASLLLPRPWLIENCRTAPETIPTVRTVAERAGVSMTMSFLRLRDVLGWDQSLLSLARNGPQGEWRVRAMFRRTKGLFHYPHLLAEASSRLDDLNTSSPEEPWTGRLDVSIRGLKASLIANVVVGRGRGLAIARIEGATSPSPVAARRRRARIAEQTQLQLFHAG